jgi:antitoxin component YwqK of YwqJK toxin-antitoxin module
MVLLRMTIKYIMMKTGTLGMALGLTILTAAPGGPVFAQVFRGYYPGGSQVQVKSDKQDGKKVIRAYYPSGKTEVVYEYENGKLDGTVRQYFENGVLKAEIRYHEGKRKGQAKYYYSNGMLMARIEYDNDRETGVSRFYDENGRPMKAPEKQAETPEAVLTK